MSVLLLAGPMDNIQAQEYLESRIIQKLSDLGSDTHGEAIRARVNTELRWIADHGFANLFLLLESWVNKLQDNSFAWWAEMPDTPIVGWILGICQTLQSAEGVSEPSDSAQGIVFITSRMGERILLASELRQLRQLEDPSRYVSIRWNCFWSSSPYDNKESLRFGPMGSVSGCSFFRYDGLTLLEELEYATCVRRREHIISKEDVREALKKVVLCDHTERQTQLYGLSLFWKEDGLQAPEWLSYSGVPEYLEALAMANIAMESGQTDIDAYNFFMERTIRTLVSYQFPADCVASIYRYKSIICRSIDRWNLLEQGLSDEDIKWMDGIQHLYAPQYLRGIGEIAFRIDYYRRRHPMEWRRVMEAKGLETVSEELKIAFETIRFTALNQVEYQQKVELGQLADYAQLSFSMGDRKFAQLHPTHPMAEKNRFDRIAAADRIRDLASERLNPFPGAALDKIYEQLFDCCGAVRHSLASALYHAGDHSSVAVLERLVQEETDSKMVHDVAEVAAMRCRQRGFGCKQVPLEGPAVALVSQDINLAIELHRVAQETGWLLIFPEPDTSDLFAFPAAIRVVNRRALGIKGWDYYVWFQKELLRPIREVEQKELEKAGIDCSELTREDAVLILTDGFFAEKEEAWGLLPEAGLQVYRTEEWMGDWIVAKVRELAGRP